ncbi:Oxoglutarate/iron-dependent dioxygenase [Corchorus olitorius]|uniref:Oxoglutarate/iron-dependent dioxygenase n=1 Tax=Corchorus olitorius TaxID=93759 RepID=A0A1R3JZ93_9ROSI|nr:Oxoglutarate/iron-dependent dioxygenase [Corchorus olitorius]
MGSETPIRLPIIDFSKQDLLKPGTLEWDLLKGQVRQAAEEFGCFHALLDQTHLELRKEIIGAMEDLFDLPPQAKMRYPSKNFYDGYMGPRPTAPLHEMLGISDATIPENVEAVTNTLWTQGKTSFSKIVQSFSKQVSGSDQIIRRMILESFGLENHIDSHMESSHYVFRAIKYKEPQAPAKMEIGVGAHIDANILTILYGNEVDGLEVQTKDGKWIHVQQPPNSSTVIMGDSLSVMLNGRLFAPNHRVMMWEGNYKARYSAGLFSTLKGGYQGKTLKEMVDEEHPLLFKPFDYLEYLTHYRAKDLDLKPGTDEWDTVKGQVQEALKEYGCFEVKLNKVPSELSKDVFHVLKELFDLPQETKELNVPEKPFQGYAGPHPQAPLYESIGIDEPNITANLESLSNTFWPQGNKNFRSTMESFLDQVSGLDRMIRRMILESFGLEKYMDEHMNSVKYLLRANRYQGPETTDDKTLAMSSHSDEKTLAMSSHSDRSIITILRQINEVDGLEIQTKDGKWNPVKYSSPDSFIVMIGDSLYAWLNGRVQLPYHRVTMSGNNSRILEVRKPLFGALEEFFDLPLQTKILCVFESLTGINGYHGAKAPLRETMSIQGGEVAQDIEQQLTNIAWPQGNSSFRACFWIREDNQEDDFGEFWSDKYMDEYMDFTNYSMRLMKAEPQKSDPNLIAHYDLGLLTLLYENEVGGLEIQNKDGEWLKLKSSPNSLIVMVWLNGGLPAPFHRVITAGNSKTRYGSFYKSERRLQNEGSSRACR